MRVQDVEAIAAIHEHLGEPGVADDWINDERVLSRIRDVVGVVLAAEGDGVLRPVEVGWRGIVDGEDLSVLSLALPRGHVRRWSAEDEEHVLHRGVAVDALVLHFLIRGLVLVAETVEVPAEHVALFEGMVDRALMIRTWLLQHVVE